MYEAKKMQNLQLLDDLACNSATPLIPRSALKVLQKFFQSSNQGLLVQISSKLITNNFSIKNFRSTFEALRGISGVISDHFQARSSRNCRFYCFLPHTQLVSLKTPTKQAMCLVLIGCNFTLLHLHCTKLPHGALQQMSYHLQGL